MDRFDLLAVQGTLNSLLQHHSSNASVLWCSAFFIVQLSHPYMTTGKTIALTRQTFVYKVMSLLFNMLSRLVIAFLPGTNWDDLFGMLRLGKTFLGDVIYTDSWKVRRDQLHRSKGEEHFKQREETATKVLSGVGARHVLILPECQCAWSMGSKAEWGLRWNRNIKEPDPLRIAF